MVVTVIEIEYASWTPRIALPAAVVTAITITITITNDYVCIAAPVAVPDNHVIIATAALPHPGNRSIAAITIPAACTIIITAPFHTFGAITTTRAITIATPLYSAFAVATARRARLALGTPFGPNHGSAALVPTSSA